jgi:homoserine dehydrogenase
VRVLPAQIETRSAGRIGPDAFVDARRRRGTIRQIAHATFDRERRTLSAWVAPIVVPVDSVFGKATGPENAVVIKGSYAGNLTLTGSGAGGDATAVAVIGDVVAIARDRAAIVPAPVLTEPERVLGLTDRQLAEAV